MKSFYKITSKTEQRETDGSCSYPPPTSPNGKMFFESTEIDSSSRQEEPAGHCGIGFTGSDIESTPWITVSRKGRLSRPACVPRPIGTEPRRRNPSPPDCPPESDEKHWRRDLFESRNVEAIELKKSKNKKKKHSKKLDPQSGIADWVVSAQLRKLGLASNLDLAAFVENTLLAMAVASQCTSTVHFLGVTAMYLKNIYPPSVTKIACEYLCSVFKAKMEPHTGDFTLVDLDRPRWLKELKGINTNWKLAVAGESFKKISQLLSMCVALGLCKITDIVPTVGGLQMFHLPTLDKQATAISLMDATFEIVTYFAEGGYMAFKTGSIKPLLYGSLEAQVFSEYFLKCQACSLLQSAGNLAMENMSENDYDKLLFETMSKGESLCQLASSSFEKELIRKQIFQLNKWKVDFTESRVTGHQRVAPFTLGVYGGTCLGKTNIGHILMNYLLLVNGYDNSPNCIVTINESDRYMSNYKSFVTGIFLDDIGNTNPNFVTTAPTERLIQIVNNCAMPATMADVESKGKVSIQPKVVICTKNVKDSGASIYSNEPMAIARRENFLIEVFVKDEYAVDKMLDQKKLKEHFPDGTPLVPNLWNFHVQRCTPIKGPPREPDRVGWKTVFDDTRKVPMNNVEIDHLLEFLRGQSALHFSQQEQYVEKNKTRMTKMEICTCCSLPSAYCKEASKMPLTPVEEADEEDDNRSTLTMDTSSIDGKNPFYSEGSSAPRFVNARPLDHQSGKVASLTKWFRPRTYQTDLEWISKRADSFLKGPTLLSGMAYFSLAPIAIGNYFLCTIDSFAGNKARKWLPVCFGTILNVEKCATKVLVRRLEHLQDSPYLVWTNWIPAGVYKHAMMQEFLVEYTRAELQQRVINNNMASFANFVFSCFFALYTLRFVTGKWTFVMFVLFNLLSVLTPLIHMMRAADAERKLLLDELAKKHDAVPATLKQIRESRLTWILGSSALLAALYMAIRSYRAGKTLMPQSDLDPSPEEIDERDARVNPWKHVVEETRLTSEASRTIVHKDLENIVAKNLCYVTTLHNGQMYTSNVFFPCSNVAIFPHHFWKAQNMEVNFLRSAESVGANFKAIISYSSSMPIINTDLCLVYIPSGGDWKNLTKYFPQTPIVDCPGKLIYKDKNAEMRSSLLYVKSQEVVSAACTFDGGLYELEWPTFAGLCMAPIISQTKTPEIVGFHLCGRTGDRQGGMGTLLLKDFQTSFNLLKRSPGVLLCKSDNGPPEQIMDTQIFTGQPIHRKSAVRHLEGEPSCRVYGSIIGMSSPQSTVVTSPVSSSVTKHTGVEQQWGPPKLHKDYPFQKSLQSSCTPCIGVPANELQVAVRDYTVTLDVLVKKTLARGVKIEPLDDVAIISGIDGLRFIDAMKSNTSVGFPFGGPKSRLLSELEPTERNAAPKTITKEFWDELARVEECYLNGDRSCQVFKASLKDEPTKLTKDKVRVFQGASMVLSMGVRKYFLPIARILSLYPTHSECAVGINAESPEWEEMDDYITTFGKDRILAGDYAKYDLTMPAQFTLAAFRMLIDTAEKLGYSQRDLSIMEGFATEVCYPYTAFNGDLIKFLGSNPSGQNLTVYINSMVNSLLLRCAFFKIYPNERSFKSRVAAMTYGDDVKSSVHIECDGFNHISFAAYLKNIGMTFTMPDKNSVATKYMHSDDCDFLKRKSFLNPDIGCVIGVLDENSIFKSLHCQMVSKALLPNQIAAQNIDGALRSWFFYGKEKYETRRQQMIKIAEECQVAHMCSMLTVEYEPLVERFKKMWEPSILKRKAAVAAKHSSREPVNKAHRQGWTLFKPYRPGET